jgi:hypothetical protein
MKKKKLESWNHAETSSLLLGLCENKEKADDTNILMNHAKIAKISI